MSIQKIIAFDVGDKRIGVAVSDPFGEYAMPSETYFRTRDFSADVAAIAAMAKERGANVIVCGMPVNFDGSESVQTEKTRRFVEALKAATDIPVELEDERFTTMQAREVQIQSGIKRDKRKESIDSIAAAYILDGYLARMKKQNLSQGAIGMDQDFENEEYDEEEHVIELEDDEGNSEKYLHIATIEYRGSKYCCFQKYEPQTEEEEDEVVIFLLDDSNEEDPRLVPLDDEQLLDEVFAEFCAQYEEYENSDDARKLEPDEE